MLHSHKIKKISPELRLDQILFQAYKKAVMAFLSQDYHYNYDYVLDRFTKKYRKKDVSNIDYDLLFNEFEDVLRNRISTIDVLSYLKKDLLKNITEQEMKTLKMYIQQNIINNPRKVLDRDYFADIVLLTICCDPY